MTMLAEIHEFIRGLMYEQGKIDPREVDILFEAPTRETIDRLTMPSISFYLLQMKENTDLRQTGMQERRVNGHIERRVPPRRVDLLYQVSAITTDVDDQHRLLWRALATLMRYQQFPDEILPESIRGVSPPLTAKVAQDDGVPSPLEIWNSLSTHPRPSFSYVLTAPVDLDITIQSPLVLTRTARYVRFHGAPGDLEVAAHIGGVLRSADGSPLAGATIFPAGYPGEHAVTSPDGTFVLRGLAPGSTEVRVVLADGAQRTLKLQVPSDSYVIVVD